MDKCSVDKCDNECFEEEDKCVLHCKKDERNGWILDSQETSLNKKWNVEYINFFWKYYEEISSGTTFKIQIPPLLNYKLTYNIEIHNAYILDDFIIKSFPDKSVNLSEIVISDTQINGDLIINLYEGYKEVEVNIQLFENIKVKNIEIKGSAKYKLTILNINAVQLKLGIEKDSNFQHSYNEVSINNSNEYLIEEIYLNNISIDNGLILNSLVLNILDCSNSTFHSNVKIQESNILDVGKFENTKFVKLADFYRTIFNEVSFYKADFENVAVFSETNFQEDIDFKYTKFLGYSIFRDTVIEKKLNLRNTIFDSSASANFLDISKVERDRSKKGIDEFIGKTTSIEVSNRETARIIKDFYDKSNNIIEANKFYSLEMKEMEKELDWFKNPSQWLIFKLHSISSNHSQSWSLALLWIINLSFLFSVFCMTDTKERIIDYILYAFIGLVFFYIWIDVKSLLKIGLTSILILFSFTTTSLNTIADQINPFSIMTSKDPITFGLLLFKITIAYLIYQFIVSVRQNTRRK